MSKNPARGRRMKSNSLNYLKMITTQFNHLENCKDCFEKVKGISLTVPNQALSIHEILRRSGVIDSGLPVYYDDNPDHDDVDPTTVSGFDLSDVS